MVIRSLDDRKRYAQSVVADLQPLVLEYVWAGDGRGAFGSSHIGIYWLPIDTKGLSLTFWLQFQRGTFRASRLGERGEFADGPIR